MAMKPLKTAHDMFYFVEDVMRFWATPRSKSYKVIKSLNRELENQGKCTCDGRVIKRYFNERYGLEDVETRPRGTGGVPWRRAKAAPGLCQSLLPDGRLLP